MKLLCEGLDLSDAVLKVIKGTSNKTTNPLLEGIKLSAENDNLVLSATDLELAIIKTIKADVFLDGETVVPGRFFSEFIKKLTNEQIELNLDETNKLTIKYTDSVSNVQCLNASEFPAIKNLTEAEYFEINSKDFKNLINKTIFSVAQDDSRPILKGTLLEVENGLVKAVALDGYRLALVQKPVVSASANLKVIVPAKSLSEISKLLEDTEEVIKVYVQKNYLMVEVNATKIITRLLDGDFINYKQIIPSDFSTVVTVNKEQLEDGLERASLLSRIDKNNLVKFDINDKLMILSSKSDIGDIKENITIGLNGKDLAIAFNARYFSEAMRVIGDEFIKLNFKTTVAPCIITSANSEEFLYLILPVRMV
jgi:DNA polymerase-3 subunit beta